MTDAVRREVRNGVATLTLDQPERRNSLTTALLDGLGDGLRDAMEDDAVRVIVLTGEGPAFCAGANLKQDDERPPRYGLVEVFDAIRRGPKPVVGRIQGHCTGGGVGLAAGCDLSIAADDVQLGFTEVRIGVAPAVISVVCLPKMRPADAAELFLTGRRISAARAVEVGLLNEAVHREELDAAVDALVEQLLAGGPNALAASKRLLADVPGADREEAFRWTSELSASLFRAEEAQAGMAAFREKRIPPWVPAKEQT